MVSIIRFNRKIRKSGRSAVVALPTDLLNSLGWEVGDEIIISATPERAVLIEKA